MQGRDLNEQRDCGEREEPEVQMQRDDREWEGGVWVAQNQVHFSQHLPIQHSTSHKQHRQTDLQIQSMPHTRRVLIKTVHHAVRTIKKGECATVKKALCACESVVGIL